MPPGTASADADHQSEKDKTMKKTVTILAGLALLMGATPSIANDLSGNKAYHPPEGFTIRYVARLDKSEKGEVLRRATDDYVQQLQSEIASDPAVADELRSHHVAIKSVIGSRNTMSGTTIYYVK
jgi:hypothetical protein